MSRRESVMARLAQRPGWTWTLGIFCEKCERPTAERGEVDVHGDGRLFACVVCVECWHMRVLRNDMVGEAAP